MNVPPIFKKVIDRVIPEYSDAAIRTLTERKSNSILSSESYSADHFAKIALGTQVTYITRSRTKAVDTERSGYRGRLTWV